MVRAFESTGTFVGSIVQLNTTNIAVPLPVFMSYLMILPARQLQTVLFYCVNGLAQVNTGFYRRYDIRVQFVSIRMGKKPTHQYHEINEKLSQKYNIVNDITLYPQSPMNSYSKPNIVSFILYNVPKSVMSDKTNR